jgi:hypothetical protein
MAMRRLQRIPLQTRLRTVGQELLLYRTLEERMQDNAAFVLQQQWRMRRRMRAVTVAASVVNSRRGTPQPGE